jgi:hypothetical protein
VSYYNPEEFLESTTRAIEEYASDSFNNIVRDVQGNPAGLEVYEIMMEFPGPALDERTMPFTKTLIHFEIDGIDSQLLGMGDNVFADNYNEEDQTVNPQDALLHVINFDVGVWASARSGGTTSRLRAWQTLRDIFGSPIAQDTFRTITDGGDGCVEILQYQGGRFVRDTVNDVPVYRTVDGQLEVRVFSRTPISDAPVPAIEEIVQAPALTILG